MELLEGLVLGGRYRLDRLLGEGGMGAVWAARHVITKKEVALKLLKHGGGSNDKVLRRFLREARAVSAVQHPNVVQVHDVIQTEDGSPVMVMDLLDGEDLAAKLLRESRLELGELSRILLPVISAVGCAHAAGIVHRDLKPENIMLHRQADGSVVPKVLDFGIAKLSATEGGAAATAALTQTGAVMGTAYYMPPEQVFGEKDIDQRADVWAMGIIIYECLAGVRPIDGDNFGQIFKAIAMGSIEPLGNVAPWLPEDVVASVGRMLTPSRAERSTDLREIYEVLSRHTETVARSFGPNAVIQDRETVPVQSTDGVTHATGAFPPPKRRGLRTLVGVAALASVGVVVSIAVWKWPRRTAPQTVAASASGAEIAKETAALAEPSVWPVEDSGPAEASASDEARTEPPKARVVEARQVMPKQPATKIAPAPSASAPSPPTPRPSSQPKAAGGVVTEVPF